ncbi:MAG: type 4a pilus biogenesis protein PilO [Eubacteriales bacterium]
MTKKIDSKILLIILLFIVSVMVIVFTFSNIKQTYETKVLIADEQLISAQYQDELAVLNSIKAQEEDINGILLQFGYKIPVEPGEDKIIEYINDVSGEAELLGITFAARVPNDIAVEMPIKISIKSDYFTMLKILKNIVGAPRLYTVSNIDISSSDGLAVNYTINLSAYYA